MSTYRIEAIGSGDLAVEWFDTADEAMRAINRLRALRVGGVLIEDGDGRAVSDQQLAMIVMEQRLSASQRGALVAQ